MTTKHYAAHVAERQRKLETALAAAGFDGLVIQAGAPFTYFSDDQDAPFRPTPHFAHWVPLEGPAHLLHLRPGERPRLARVAPEDYWYEQAPLGNPYWAAHFDLVEVPDVERAWRELAIQGRTAYVGDRPEEATARGILRDALNPTALTARLDWDRAYKSAYEVDQLAAASRAGWRGHLAARRAFQEGASELQIHQAYVEAVGCTDKDLPYESIVGLDEKGAILHYCGKRTTGGGKVLLIDVGAQVNRYASDITRTWVTDKADPAFRELVAGLEKLQLELCALAQPGIPYLELHAAAHHKIGDLLHQAGILKVGGQEALARGVTAPFFPHGLGHFLGIQVHDVGGRQKSPEGGTLPPPPEFPYLRTTRKIEEGQVFTIEPGLYFIEMLLRPHRAGATKELFDWKLVDRLSPHGGIRIEDNVLVTRAGHRNLTREAAAAA
ncbi:MAG: Xaa-Pro dipeptidase [Planctomycetes bacterium]|nr:Xaa-Pro dipeptidase [Planctomycetota bacterium]